MAVGTTTGVARTVPAGRQAAAWTPGQEVLDHSGNPVEPGRVYFRPPPPEVGQVLTARTTLRATDQAKPLTTRLALALGGGGAVFAGVAYAAEAWADPSDAGPLTLLVAAVGLLVACWAWWATRYHHTCSYVGTAGNARYTLTGSPAAGPKAQVFSFAAAAELRASQTRQFVNGVYSGTQYAYVWTDTAGRPVLKLKGQYHSKAGTPKPNNAFWFARSTEVAWNSHQLGWVAAQVEQLGYAQFSLKSGDFVRVGPGFFEFGRKGEVARIDVADIKTLSLNDGQFTIHHKDAKWFSSKGKYGFAYATMGNAQLFLMAMEKLTGYSFADG